MTGEPVRPEAERRGEGARRVLFVLNSADLYGASRSLVRLVSRLVAAGTESWILLPEEGPLRPMAERAGATVLVDPSITIVTRRDWGAAGLWRLFSGLPISAFRIARAARRARVDLVHTNTGVIASPALGAWLAGVPHVWHIRDSFLEFQRVWPVYSRYILGFSRRVFAVSRAIADQFPESDKVVVVHDGFPRDEFAPPDPKSVDLFRARFGLAGRPVVGCVGRIKLVRKGQEHLVEAAALLKRRGVEAKYLVVGSPSPGSEPHLDVLRARIVELGLERDVVFTGELADPRPAYAAMDVFVLPSAQPEPFGGVVLEAMSMGLPVVGTAIGGTREQVLDGVTGFLVPPADPAALADRLEKLLGDAALRAAMGRRGQERVEELFSLDRHAEQVLELYAEILAGR
jgi:glycosyltransferase involved in cell wall biosynthesis